MTDTTTQTIPNLAEMSDEEIINYDASQLESTTPTEVV